ncbi:beta-ketoacyl-[acyl-carrier-protein] synthase family protein [Clostridium beijerinckii]|uniref:Actinorhodin polyketide putative beta-ketoacyl synthase 1 n=1 Tax=Clostridium beijerinckii TaxID=1520 RepID=A0A1S8SKK9_CLOBE|nr:beta-ketoacyl-[acyl-carrier-protein] synthase family protein [Clostridium beijerinckii]NRY61543.1 3-oxoacyl-(acyl-carrier-protein) synthase [Clostridium beijerinckii]OOM65862.1 actinorhodin polyketide putative beta-ketoacyl synthase 1 [Clostridium beijerinckii]
MKRVAITGIGVISPNGIGKETFWKNCCDGKSFLKQLNIKGLPGSYSRIDDLPKLKSRVNTQVDNFIPNEYMADKERYIQFALKGAEMAIEDSKINMDTINKDDIGVSFATAIGGTPLLDSVFYDLTEHGKTDLKFQYDGTSLYEASMFNTAARCISKRFDCQNICTTISTGCTSGLDSIGFAYDTIKLGEAKIMIAGGSEAPLAPMSFAAFDIINALTKNNENYKEASRPFDAKRNGFVLGEGCAMVILEEFEHAKARDAYIYGEIAGFSSGNNAYHMTDLPSDGVSLGKVIVKALEEGKCADKHIGYINAHGSSTPQNDAFETAAYKYALGEQAYKIPISSTKSMIGHSLSSASSIGLTAALLAMNSNIVPPTINYKNKDKKCDLDYIPNVKREVDIDSVLITASGFSGIHSAMYIKKVV